MTLSFGERAYQAQEFVFECDTFLDVAANPQTGYGAVIWRTDCRARWGPLADHTWHSDNPQPPSFDPRVIADFTNPQWFEPRSTVPIPQVRAVLEELWHTANGCRPTCVRWTPGYVCGCRADSTRTCD